MVFRDLSARLKCRKRLRNKLIKAFEKAFGDPEVQGHLIARHFIPLCLSGEKFIQFCDREKEINRRILGKAGLLREK